MIAHTGQLAKPKSRPRRHRLPHGRANRSGRPRYFQAIQGRAPAQVSPVTGLNFVDSQADRRVQPRVQPRLQPSRTTRLRRGRPMSTTRAGSRARRTSTDSPPRLCKARVTAAAPRGARGCKTSSKALRERTLRTAVLARPTRLAQVGRAPVAIPLQRLSALSYLRGRSSASWSQVARSRISRSMAAPIALVNGMSWWIVSTRSTPAFRSAAASTFPTS
jgi:hypothetical protein